MARKEVTIGSVQFYLQTFAPRRALVLFGDLQKELLPGLGGVLAAAVGREGGSVDQTAIIDAIRAFSLTLDGKALDRWCNELIDPERASFQRDGREPKKLEKVHFDDAFDDFAGPLELLLEIIKLNFAGPLVRWLDLSGSGLTEKLGGLLGDSSPSSNASS